MPWLLPVTAALVILVVAPHALFAFDVAPKVMVLLAGVAVVLASGRPKGIEELAGSRRGKAFLVLLALQGGSILLSTASSLDPNLSLYGTAWRRFGLIADLAVLLFAALLAGASVLDTKAVRRFLKATSLAGLLAACYGILQYSGWDPILPVASYRVGEGIWSIVRPPGTLGHASYFATFLVYAVFAAIALWLTETVSRWRWIALSSAALGSIAIVLSGTRAAMLGLVAGVAMLLIARRPRIRAAHVLAGGLILAAAAAAVASPWGEQLRARIRWSQEDSAGGARLRLWRDSFAMAAEHPVLGFGPEVFTTEFPRHQSIELARSFPDFYQESPHNIFLDVLAGQGLVGLLLLAATCVLALGCWKAAPWSPPIAAGFLAGLVSQQFGAFMVPTAMYFYAFAALLVGAQENDVPLTAAPSTFRARSSRILGLVVAFGLIVLAVQFTISEMHFGRAKEKILQGQIAPAIESQAEGMAWANRGNAYDLYFSRAWLQLSERQSDPERKFQAWQQAMASAQRAPANSDDRANALVNLAAFQASMNDAASVERTLLSAVSRAPNWFRPHWLLARLYLATGHLPEAEAQARLAVDRNGGRNPEVLETLETARQARQNR